MTDLFKRHIIYNDEGGAAPWEKPVPRKEKPKPAPNPTGPEGLIQSFRNYIAERQGRLQEQQNEILRQAMEQALRTTSIYDDTTTVTIGTSSSDNSYSYALGPEITVPDETIQLYSWGAPSLEPSEPPPRRNQYFEDIRQFVEPRRRNGFG